MGAWVNSDTTNPGPRPARMAISHDNGGFDRSLGFDTRGGGGLPPDWMSFKGSGVGSSGVDVVVDTWVFLAAVYDQASGSLRLYVNDQEFSTVSSFGGGFASTRIGSNPGFGEFFDGRIDEVFFFNEALSKDEIDQIRINGVPEPTSFLLLSLGWMCSATAIRYRTHRS